MFDVLKIRQQFPILSTTHRSGKPLVYLDNAATTQKPKVVIDALTQYYQSQNANVHRGIYDLADDATKAFEGARETVKTFLNTQETEEIIFVKGATEAMNLVASAWLSAELLEGDEVIISAMEHHSNLIPLANGM